MVIIQKPSRVQPDIHSRADYFDSAQLTQVERRQKERVAMNFYVAYNFIKANKDDNKISSFISSMTEIF